MDRNYIPYLKYNEFEMDFTPNHFNTGSDFFINEKNEKINESNSQNINYYPDHLSEYNYIIPENINFFDNRKIYKNNIFIESKDLSPHNSFLLKTKNIHLDDMNYQKYLLNIKSNNDEDSLEKRINKKNKSQNKNISNNEEYNIIQIYEAPPLELTPISENEKTESIERRKPPKYYRKKKIYTLEDDVETKRKNKLFDLDFNELEKISKKFDSKEHENNLFIKAIKSSNSKNKKRIIENRENNENKKEKKENILTKEPQIKIETKINDNIIDNINENNSDSNNNNNNSKKNYHINTTINYKKYMKKEKETKNENKELNNNKNKINYKIEDKENNNKINNNINKKDEIFQLNRELYKKGENRSFIQRQNYCLNHNINENESNKLRLTIDKKEILENNRIYNDDKDKKENKINEKEKIDNKEEKTKGNTAFLESKDTVKTYYKLENKLEGNNIITNSLDNNFNNSKKEEEIKDDKTKKEQKEKEIKLTQQIPNRNNIRQIKANENKDIIIPIIKDNETKIEKNNILNNEVDVVQKSNIKRTYLYNINIKESTVGQSSNKINNITINQKDNKYPEKNIYSFSVDKNNNEDLNERVKKTNERKINLIVHNQVKFNEVNANIDEKDSKTNKLELNLQIKNINNHSIIFSKNDGELKKENNILNNNLKEEKIIKKDNSISDYMIKNRKRSGIATPNPPENYIIEENKNIDMASFNTARKSMYIQNNYNNNTCNIDKKNNINTILNENKKENINNSKISNINQDNKIENNLTTFINFTNKNTYRNNHNHNYIAIKSSGPNRLNNITQYRPINQEKQDKVNDIKKTNNNCNFNSEGNPFILSSNKNEQKQNDSNIRENNRRLTNDLNNFNNDNNNIANNENSIINNNNYQVLRATSLKSVNLKNQNNNDSLNKRKNIAVLPIPNNHYIKMSYGNNTFKIQNDKKENYIKTINENNKNNEVNNIISNYSNNKNDLNNNLINNNNINNINNININNYKNISLDNRINPNSLITIEKKRRDTKTKNNHSVYVSIFKK